MKFVIYLFFAIVSLTKQSSPTPYVEVENAFVKKDADLLTKNSNEKLVISLFGKENIYSKAQTTLILKDFFKQHPNTNFKYNFKSKDNQDGNYAVGSFYSKTEALRVTIHFNKAEPQHKIIKLIIEKE